MNTKLERSRNRRFAYLFIYFAERNFNWTKFKIAEGQQRSLRSMRDDTAEIRSRIREINKFFGKPSAIVARAYEKHARRVNRRLAGASVLRAPE